MIYNKRDEIFACMYQAEIRQRAAGEHFAVLSQEELIPQATALRLCHEIHQEYSAAWRSLLAAWRCALCIKLARDGIPARMIASRPGYCGCPAVNMRYRQSLHAAG